MMQIDLTKTLTKVLFQHIKPARHPQPDLHWRTESALIGSDFCVAAQEVNTGYLMVMCGLDKHDIRYFPEYFARRMSSEIIIMCRNIGLPDNKPLREYISRMALQQFYCMDPEVVSGGPLLKILEKLERRFLHEKQPLPVEADAALEFTFPLNCSIPRDESKPSAAQALAERCRILVGEQMKLEANKSVISTEDNIVRVDFSQAR
tara:strand:- start:1191 stop:1805 length:615 start_codon:yes stop_codon:yes gene_type:complete